MEQTRELPIGIQSFHVLRENDSKTTKFAFCRNSRLAAQSKRSKSLFAIFIKIVSTQKYKKFLDFEQKFFT